MSRQTTRTAVLALGLGAALVATACASKPTVTQHQDGAANLRGYKTFAFFDVATADGGPYTTPVGAHLKLVTRQALERQHYVYDESSPDLRVNVFAMVVERTDLRSTPVGLGFQGISRIDARQYRQGTVIVDLVDADRNALVWRGMAEGRVDGDAMENPKPAIDEAVSEIFAHYPA